MKLLKVKQNEVHKKTVFEMVSENVCFINNFWNSFWHLVIFFIIFNHFSNSAKLFVYFIKVINNMMTGVEGITGYRGLYWVNFFFHSSVLKLLYF